MENAPEYLKIGKDCSDFFKNEGSSFKTNQLMNIFFYIEHLVFEDLVKTLHIEYKAGINKELQEKIKDKLLNNEKDEDKLFIKDLSAALRRFISRYLAGSRQTTDIKEDNDLQLQLSRIDLWEEKYGKINNLDELIDEKLKSFKLKVGQALELYKIIGNEDKNSIEEIKHINIENNETTHKKEYNNNENTDGDDDDEQNIRKKVINDDDDDNEANFKKKYNVDENENEDEEDKDEQNEDGYEDEET